MLHGLYKKWPKKHVGLLLMTTVHISTHLNKFCTTLVTPRRALDGAHLPPTKLFPRLQLVVNKTILKPRLTAATGRIRILGIFQA